MPRRSLLGITLAFALVASLGVLPARAAEQALRTDVIQLTFLKPMQVMYMLGIYGKENAEASKGGGWSKGQPTAERNSIIPDGIEFIMPYTLDNSLIVKGDAEGIADLRALIGKLDVKPRMISLTIDLWKLTPGRVAPLGMTETGSGEKTATGRTEAVYARGALAGLRSRLAEMGVSSLASLSVTTPNNQLAIVSTEISFELKRVEFSLLPRINNADGSITMLVKSGGVESTKRIASGGGIISFEPATAGKEGILSIITAKVLD